MNSNILFWTDVQLLFLIINLFSDHQSSVNTVQRRRDVPLISTSWLLSKSHEPIIAAQMQSFPIILRWRHCLLLHDFPPFILNYPPPNSRHTLGQGWAINFSKGPHEKLGRLQRAVGRVYGEGAESFCQGVTTVNKAAQHLTLKLAAHI